MAASLAAVLAVVLLGGYFAWSQPSTAFGIAPSALVPSAAAS